MFFSKKKKYDFIFGIGEACSCSSSLRSANLQLRSFPFDWIFGSDFLKRIDIINKHFENFITKENLVYMGNNGIEEHLCDIYTDKSNDLVFNHDFLSGKNFDEEFINVQNKYKRRSDRFFEYLNKSQKTLAVWVGTPGKIRVYHTDEDFVNGYKSLKNGLNIQNLDLLVFTYDEKIPFKNLKYEKISENIEKYTFNYHLAFHKGKPLADYVVDDKLMKKILKKYELNMSFKEKWENYKLKHFKKA